MLAARRREETTEQTHLNLEISEINRMERLLTTLENDSIKFQKRQIDFEVYCLEK